MTAGATAPLSNVEIETILRALVNPSRRVQCVALEGCSVWIKTYGTESRRLWLFVQRLAARVIPVAFLRPSPVLSDALMVEREARRIAQFSAAGFMTPTVLYRFGRTLVLTDNGESIAARLKALRASDPAAHEALLIKCASELGRLHSAGLCHGRPHPRDFTLHGSEIGFLDFEEEPDQVMPLSVAQARDIWLLCLQIGWLGLDPTTTLIRSLDAWASTAPEGAVEHLARMTRTMNWLLPAARLINRVQRGADVQRFVTAMTVLAYIQL